MLSLFPSSAHLTPTLKLILIIKVTIIIIVCRNVYCVLEDEQILPRIITDTTSVEDAVR